jgi:RNA polymerase sigma-70 factor (ECF subfamily)
VFLEAARAFPQFRGRTEGELVAWLLQVLASKLGGLVRRYLGAGRRNVRREQDLVAELDGCSWCPDRSPSHEAARREQAVLVAGALGRLPEHYREVVTLHHMEGLSLPETARRMGRTADGVGKLWVRALARLRDLLGERQCPPAPIEPECARGTTRHRTKQLTGPAATPATTTTSRVSNTKQITWPGPRAALGSADTTTFRAPDPPPNNHERAGRRHGSG